tara:strand:+ start:352 stop:552 length:201 start_codon:yes stop_codon:yes gene_type:complete
MIIELEFIDLRISVFLNRSTIAFFLSNLSTTNMHFLYELSLSKTFFAEEFRKDKVRQALIFDYDLG